MDLNADPVGKYGQYYIVLKLFTALYSLLEICCCFYSLFQSCFREDIVTASWLLNSCTS